MAQLICGLVLAYAGATSWRRASGGVLRTTATGKALGIRYWFHDIYAFYSAPRAKVRFAPAHNPGFRATVGWLILEAAEPGATGGGCPKVMF